MYHPAITEYSGENAIKLLHRFLFKRVHEKDRPFEVEYFNALTSHAFGDHTVAYYFHRRFLDKRRDVYQNLYLIITGRIVKAEVRQAAARLVPGNDGIMTAQTDEVGSFFQKFSYPTPVEHTYSNFRGGKHRGVCGIVQEYCTTDMIM